jgi:hypothetical protein
LDTAQPDIKNGAATSPTNQHGRSLQSASERLNSPRPWLDTPGIPA